MADTRKSLFVDQYLKRLQYSGPALPNLETLQKLHYNHMLTIPFENLNNIKNKPYFSDKQELFEKIIQGQRGGLCFELNSLFGFLLHELGFEVITCSASVFEGATDSFLSRDSHLIHIVSLKGERSIERWVADVGFGDGFTVPLRIVANDIQDGGNSFYRFKRAKGHDEEELFDLEAQSRRDEHGCLIGTDDETPKWTPMYRFTTEPRTLDYFDESRKIVLKDPESHFNQGLICTALRPWGRITLSKRKLIKTYVSNKKVVRKDVEVLASEDDVRLTLENEFGVKYN